MLDSGASTNVMTLEVMNELGLTISRPYRNVQGIDSREKQVCGVIKGLKVRLQEFSNRILTMDVVVTDCLAKWGTILSKKWAANAGGNIKMDWSYVGIPMTPGYKVRFF